MITQERLKEVLDYDPSTGEFTWRQYRCGLARVGDTAGTMNKGGYRVVVVDSKQEYAHRLAWLDVHGYLPEQSIDHINRNPSDNSIKNLREVSHRCNLLNTGNQVNCTSGVKGVNNDKKSTKWRAVICVRGKTIHLGLHVDFTEAVCHRLAAEQAEDWAGCDVSSPAFKYVQRMLAA